MSVSAWRQSLRRLRRGWRSGELLIVALAIGVAVAVSASVGLFSDRVRSALASQTGEAFGADAVLLGQDPAPPALVAELEARGLSTARTASFPSVMLAGEAAALVSVKAATERYPLRGELRVSDTPFGTQRVQKGPPAPGSVFVDPRLWQELGLALDAPVQLGERSFTVAALLDYEPDRSDGFGERAPRVLIHDTDLASTGLVTVGSRVGYGLMLAGPPALIERLKKRDWPLGSRLVTAADSREHIRATLDRAGRFLDVAVLVTTLLSATLVALAARQHGLRRRDEVALLKTLGAESGWIGATLSFDLLLVGATAGAAGALIGFAGQWLLVAALSGVLELSLPAPSPVPLLSAWALGLAVLFGFALPPVLAARRTPPIRVLQRDIEAGRSPWVAAAAVVTAGLLLAAQSGDPVLAGWVLAGAVATATVLAALAWLAVRALIPLRRAGGTALRFGLGNVARRQGATVAQVVALGLALLALLLAGIVRTGLLQAWRDGLPPDTPNQFLINIQPGQVGPLKAFFAERGITDLTLWPMVRARLVAINGEPVTPESFGDLGTRDGISHEFNLSWTETFGDDNRLIAGHWWAAATRSEPWLSVEEHAAERLGIGVGDRMSLQFADRVFELTVFNVRETEWESFRPNFFLVTPPGTLNAAAAQWLTRFYLPKDQRWLLPEMVRAFPNVIPLDLDAAMTQVRGIIGRVASAIEVLFGFALAAGLTVLLAAIEGTRDDRIRETALLRVLGARSRTIAIGIISEYAALGLIAGGVAAACAQALAWVLAELAFDMHYGLSPELWLAGATAGCALVTALGWLSLRGIVRTPPSIVLRAG